MNKKLNWKALTIAVMLAANVIAFAKDSVTLKLNTPVSLNGSRLAAGEYNVAWVIHSPEATVTFAQRKQVVATASAKLVDRNQKYKMTEIVYQTDSDGLRTLLEIRLEGTSKALVFGE